MAVSPKLAENVFSALPSYETVAASQSDQVLGTVGSIGDIINHVLVIPTTTTPGNVILTDGTTAITVFVGGTTTVVPFTIQLNMVSKNGPFKLTTGTNVSCIAVGSFT